MEHLAAVELAEHFEDARDLAPGRLLGPALARMMQVRAEVAVPRVLERQAVQNLPVRAEQRKRVVDADRPRMPVEQLPEVRFAQPPVDPRADLDAHGLRDAR